MFKNKPNSSRRVGYDEGKALFKQAMQYYFGTQQVKNYSQAFRILQTPTCRLYPQTNVYLGHCYQHGLGVDTNRKKAFEYYSKAALNGIKEAYFYLGCCHDEGIGTHKDPQAAEIAYRRAADLGHADSQYNLGITYAKSKDAAVREKAFHAFTAASRQMHGPSLCCLAFYYKNGLYCTKDEKQYVRLMLAAASQGDRYAQNHIGTMYLKGDLVKKKLSLGFHWVYQAALQGDSYSMNACGVCFAFGHGVTRNLPLAHYWLTRAKQKGRTIYPDAQHYLDESYREMHQAGRILRHTRVRIYTRSSAPHIDFTRYVTGKPPFYRRVSVASEPGHDNFIIADPTLNRWPKAFYKKFSLFIQQCKANKHTLYACNSAGRLTEVDDKLIQHSRFITDINQLKRKASAQGVSHPTFLDYHTIRNQIMLKGESIPPLTPVELLDEDLFYQPLDDNPLKTLFYNKSSHYLPWLRVTKDIDGMYAKKIGPWISSIRLYAHDRKMVERFYHFNAKILPWSADPKSIITPLSHFNKRIHSLDGNTKSLANRVVPARYAVKVRNKKNTFSDVPPDQYRLNLYNRLTLSKHSIDYDWHVDNEEKWCIPLNQHNPPRCYDIQFVDRVVTETIEPGQYIHDHLLTLGTQWIDLISCSPYTQWVQFQKNKNIEVRFNAVKSNFQARCPTGRITTSVIYVFNSHASVKQLSIWQQEMIIAYQCRDKDKGISPTYVHKKIRSAIEHLIDTCQSMLEIKFSAVAKILSMPANRCDEAEKVAALYQFFHSYQNAELSSPADSPLGTLEQIIMQAKGACRHRVISFMALSCYLENPTVINRNDVHAYIEMHNYANHTMMKVDLGGPPVNTLAIQDSIENPFLSDAEHFIDDNTQWPEEKASNEHTSDNISADKTIKALQQHARQAVANLATTQQKVIERVTNFDIWQHEKPSARNADDFFVQLLHKKITKPHSIIVEYNNQNDQQNAIARMVHHAINNNQRCYYVDCPDELSTLIPFCVHASGDVIPNPKKETHLSRFLSVCQQHRQMPHLIINVANANQWISILHNALDSHSMGHASIDMPILITIHVVHDSDRCFGRETISRIDQYIDFNLACSKPKPIISEMPLNKIDSDDSLMIIECYNDPDSITAILTGDYPFDPTDERVTYQPGKLQVAINAHKISGVILKNPPAHTQHYQTLIHHMIKQGWFIDASGKVCCIPPAFRFQAMYGYTARERLPNNASDIDFDSRSALVLNEYNYHCFGDGLAINEEKQRLYQPQYLREHVKETKETEPSEISIYVSHQLSDEAQAEFMQYCRQNRKIPRVKRCFTTEDGRVQATQLPLSPKVTIIWHADVDYALRLLRDGTIKNEDVIDVSDMDSDDLFSTIGTPDSAFSTEQPVRCQRGYLSCLQQCADSDKASYSEESTIILKGTFKSSLIQTLAPYLRISHQRLIILANDESYFSFAMQSDLSSTMSIPDNTKASLAATAAGLNEHQKTTFVSALPKIKPLSYADLETWAQYVRGGLSLRDYNRRCYSSTKRPLLDIDLKEIDFNLIGQMADDLDAKRLSEIKSILANRHHVFIVGPTGSGKSTFVQQHASAMTSSGLCFTGIENMENWLKKGGVLFIDEINIEHKEWTLFESLYTNKQPLVLVNDKLHPVNPGEHLLICAGNDASKYNRYMGKFLRSRGGVTIFEQLPASYLIARILEPLLRGIRPDIKSQLAVLFMTAFNQMHDDDSSVVTVTPRDLGLMALITLSQKPTIKTVFDIAKSAIGIVAHGALSPDQQQQFQQAYHSQYEIACDQLDHHPCLFFPQDNHRVALQALHAHRCAAKFKATLATAHQDGKNMREQLALAGIDAALLDDEMKDTKQVPTLSPLCSTGYSIVCLESEPGMGKTALITAFFDSKHCKRIQANAPVAPSSTKNRYFKMPADIDCDVGIGLLDQASNAGISVMVDEFNCQFATAHEPALNRFGQSPGQQAHEQSLLFATQNPDYMRGGRYMPPAVRRRTALIRLSSYTEANLLAVLEKKGLPPRVAAAIIKMYALYRAIGERKKTHLLPTPRDLFRAADQYQKHIRLTSCQSNVPKSPYAFKLHTKDRRRRNKLVSQPAFCGGSTDSSDVKQNPGYSTQMPKEKFRL